MRKLLSIITLVASMFCLSACQTLDYTVTKRSEIDKRIAAARAETETHLKLLTDEQVKLLRDKILSYESVLQTSSNYLFKGSAMYGMLKAPTRPEMIMGQSIQLTAANLPAASPAVQAEAFRQLQTELDEAKTTVEQLKAQYARELGAAQAEAKAKSEEVVAIDTRLKAVEAERVEVVEAGSAKERELQAEKDKVQDEQLARKTKEAEDAKKLQALKTKLSSILGVIALACLAGAIWSPVMKTKFALAAGILSFAAVAIWFIEGWMVALAGGVGILVLILWAARNHYIESKTATDVYRAIQSVKDNAKEDYERVLKPTLTQWVTKYDKATGKTVPDLTAIKHIDARLMETGDK